MFAPAVFSQSVFAPSVFPPGIPEPIVVPGTSGAGGVYGGLVAPQPVRRRREEPITNELQDMRDIIDIIAIMVKNNMI